MATATRTKEAVEAKAEEPVDEVWAKLQTENHIPPLVIRGLSLVEPKKNQIDAWRDATTIEAGERALFGDQYDAVHALFADEPQHVWGNFNDLYLKHMFGTTGDENLAGSGA